MKMMLNSLDSPIRRGALWVIMVLLFSVPALTACAQTDARDGGLTREEAIAIARKEIDFEPASTEAEETMENDRPVWRITFRGVSGPHPMGPLMIVSVDRETGRVLSLARS
jgi:hypothetical protein